MHKDVFHTGGKKSAYIAEYWTECSKYYCVLRGDYLLHVHNHDEVGRNKSKVKHLFTLGITAWKTEQVAAKNKQ